MTDATARRFIDLGVAPVGAQPATVGPENLNSMLLYVAGASCSGKTTIAQLVAQTLHHIEIHDFDELGVPEGADVRWRQEANERWLQRAAGSQRPVLLMGQSPFGEILAAPSATRLAGIACCLIDCDDWVRVQRLRERGTPPATQEQLSWAAWHRVHARDPRWHPEVMEAGLRPYGWDRWSRWLPGDRRWQFEIFNTTAASPPVLAELLSRWADEQLQMLAAGTLPLSGRWWE